MEEAHRTQIKVFKQKVQHLEYEHKNNCKNEQIKAQKVMKEERIYHTENDKNMLKDKKQYKDDYQREDHQHQSEIETQINKLDQDYKDLEQSLNFQRVDLISKYD